MGKWITINVRGIVIAAAWKQDSEISAVGIAGYDEKRYRVADDHFDLQLRALIKQSIVVDGFIETKNNNSVTHIHHFHIDSSDAEKAANTPDGQQPDLPPIGDDALFS